jgi:hypothetical protein
VSDKRSPCVLEMRGPEGGNLLGFLTAVGALATLADAWPDRVVRLSWMPGLAWYPLLGLEVACSKDDVVTALDQELKKHRGAPEFFGLGDDLPVVRDNFRIFAEHAATAANPTDRRSADFVAAYGSDAVTDDKQRIRDTAFRALGGGQQHFLKSVRELAELTKEQHLRQALFERWEYRDPRPSMRWDPADDRKRAYRSDDPSTSTRFPILTVRGANRLAVEALRCFPTAPQGSRLATTGFAPRGADRGVERFRWPLWDGFLTPNVVRSLLSHPVLWADPLPVERLQLLGVLEILECRRVTDGKYRNFTAAQALVGSGAAS